MMAKYWKPVAYLYLFFAIFLLLSPIVSANSAEPPKLTIIIVSPPEDLSVTIQFADGKISEPLTKTKVGWETYYSFFYHGLFDHMSFDGASFQVTSGEKSFSIPLPEADQKYNTIYTLNYKNETLRDGKDPLRDVFLIAIRVSLTLIIEGLIFFAFGYRARASWIAFFVINLITQGLLNATISGPYNGGYWLLFYIFFEIIIIIVEPLIAMAVIRERRKLRTWLCFLFANIISLIIGGMVIVHIPV